MSQRTNLKKAFKIARMVMTYGASERTTKKAYIRHHIRLPARQQRWVIRSVYIQLHEPFMVPKDLVPSATGFTKRQEF